MTDPNHADASTPPSLPRLQLRTLITPEFLDRVEAGLLPVFHDCLMRHRRRYTFPKVYPFLFGLVRVLSVIGLALSLWLLFTGGCRYRGIRLEFIFIPLFMATLALFWNTKKRIEKLLAPHTPYWSGLATRRTRAMLRVARKTVPFTAEYDLRGEQVVYYRVTGDTANFVWTRQLKGFRVCGNGFVVLFRKERSLYPYAILLHDAAAELEPYLDRIGVPPFPQTAGDQPA
jgi:hypothetical protein